MTLSILLRISHSLKRTYNLITSLRKKTKQVEITRGDLSEVDPSRFFLAHFIVKYAECDKGVLASFLSSFHHPIAFRSIDKFAMGGFDVYCAICGGGLRKPSWTVEEDGEDSEAYTYDPAVLANDEDPELNWLEDVRLIGENSETSAECP